MQKLNIADVEKFAKYYKKLNMVGGSSKQQRDIYAYKINDYSTRLTHAGFDVNKIAKIIQSGGSTLAEILAELNRTKEEVHNTMVAPADVSVPTTREIARIGENIAGVSGTIDTLKTQTEELIHLHTQKLAQVRAEFDAQLAAANADREQALAAAARELQQLQAQSAADIARLRQDLEAAGLQGDAQVQALQDRLNAAQTENTQTVDEIKQWAIEALNEMRAPYTELSEKYTTLATAVAGLRDLPPDALQANLAALQETIRRGTAAAQQGGGGGRRRRY